MEYTLILSKDVFGGKEGNGNWWNSSSSTSGNVIWTNAYLNGTSSIFCNLFSVGLWRPLFSLIVVFVDGRGSVSAAAAPARTAPGNLVGRMGTEEVNKDRPNCFWAHSSLVFVFNYTDAAARWLYTHTGTPCKKVQTSLDFDSSEHLSCTVEILGKSMRKGPSFS